MLVGTVPTELGAISELSTLDIGKRHIVVYCYCCECGDYFIDISYFIHIN